MKEINMNEFEAEVLKANGPVVVDFGASWCKPCQALAKTLEQFSTTNLSVKIVKIDVEKNSQLASTYNVMGVPTLILFKNGKPVNQMSGNKSLNDLNKFIKE